jgi:LysR family nitrogen assimilation transcriptional regulator
VALTREELGAARGALAGRVSIGLPPSLSKLITVPLAKAFAAHLPKAQLSLTEGFSVRMHEGLRVGNLDMAVLYNPEQSPDLEMSTLHEDVLTLISPAAGAAKNKREATASLIDVADLPLILPSRPNAFRILIEGEMMAIGKRPNVILEVDGLNAILNLVKEGMGHAILPGYTLSNFENAAPFSVKTIHSPAIKSQLMLVWSARRPTTQTQKKAMELVSEVLLRSIAQATPAVIP